MSLEIAKKTLTDLLIELNGIQWTLDPWKKSLRMKKVINFKVLRANDSSQTKKYPYSYPEWINKLIK